MDFFALALKRFVSKTKVCYRAVDNQADQPEPSSQKVTSAKGVLA